MFPTDLWLPGAGRGGDRWRGGWLRGLGLTDADYYTDDKRQGPTAEQGELYSISCDKP